MSAPAFKAMAELAASLHGVISRSQAAALGLSSREINTAKRHGWLSEPVIGALVVNGHPRSWQQQLAVVLAARERTRPAVSHRAGGRLHHLDGCDEDFLEVSVELPGKLRPLPALDVIAHQVSSLPRSDLVRIGGLTTTGLARTLADLGSVVSEDRLWRAVISARKIHAVSPIWLQRTAIHLHRPGQRGTGMLLRALDRWAAEGTLPESWFEELIARLLRDPRIPAFVRQHEIRDEEGRFVARPDLAIPTLRLGLEAHSREFHFEPIYGEADEDRDLRAAAVGWELIYLGWYANRRPARVVELIAKVCERRAGEVRTIDAPLRSHRSDFA